MPNVHRAHSDYGTANPKGEIMYPVAAGTVIAQGDLLFKVTSGANAGQVLPMSDASIWNSTIALTRENASEKFVGVAMSAHPSAGVNENTVRVATRGVFKYPLGTNATFLIGDLIGVDQTGATNFVEAQSVEKVTHPAQAIGRSVEHHAVARAEVEFEILGRDVVGGGQRAYLTS